MRVLHLGLLAFGFVGVGVGGHLGSILTLGIAVASMFFNVACLAMYRAEELWG